MREIKFRGKRKDNGEWVYGSLVNRTCDGINVSYIYDDYYDETEICEYCNSSDRMEPKDLKDLFIPVLIKSVGQSIGLKDCEGKEIYENDIVTGICAIMGGSKENYGNFFIAWDNKEGRWELTSKEEKPSWKGCGTTTIPHFVISKAWTLEIIGNRFENPELLTKKG